VVSELAPVIFSTRSTPLLALSERINRRAVVLAICEDAQSPPLQPDPEYGRRRDRLAAEALRPRSWCSLALRRRFPARVQASSVDRTVHGMA
jgi:hypothetical protein